MPGKIGGGLGVNNPKNSFLLPTYQSWGNLSISMADCYYGAMFPDLIAIKIINSSLREI
jgi:hypothetical protein